MVRERAEGSSMTEPSTLSGVLGLVLLFAVLAIALLLVEWASEKW